MVRCDEVVLSNIDINVGVPQGNIFEPLLFALYVNDIGQQILNPPFWE